MGINKDGAFDDIRIDSCGILPELSIWEQFQSRVFGWNNNTAFFNVVPFQWLNYYRNTLQVCINFAQGYDPTIHGLGKLISTRSGCVVVRTIVDQIMSGDVQFDDLEQYGEGEVKCGEATTFIADEWAKKFNFVSFLYKLFTFSVSGGAALAKLNIDADGNLWPDCLRIDRYYANLDSRGEVRDVQCYISVYEETIPKGGSKNWFLIERRFYGEDGKPTVIYGLQPLEGLVNSPTVPFGSSVPFEAVPEEVRNSFVQNYGTVRLNTPVRFPLADLGCYLVKNTENSIIVPDMRFGDSSLLNIIPALIGIDQAYTNMINDQYIGAGWVYAPASTGDALMTDGVGKRLRLVPPSIDGAGSQKMEAVQFNLRVDEWEHARDMYLRMIAAATGISANTLSSHLASDVSGKTVAEIASEDNKTTNMVENKRFLASVAINKMLDEVLQFYKHPGKVGIRFSKSGLTNMRNLSELTIMKYQAGLLSLRQAVTDLHPDWTEGQIDEEVAALERAGQEESQMRFGSEDDFGEEGMGGIYGHETMSPEEGMNERGNTE